MVSRAAGDSACSLAQLAAVNNAISHGGYALVAIALEQRLAEGGRDSVDT
ncbi:hypothetical protein ABT390_21830 [Streptomyces aurantiacus]|nr:hypothetical protein [Streptomyces aurantiacus]